MLNEKVFGHGVILIKENYNLNDYPENTINAWYVILKNKLNDPEYRRCVSILMDTIPNWYQAGESLASRVLAVLPKARQELQSERLRMEAMNPPKELSMSDDERRRNVGTGAEMLKRLTEKLSAPRQAGESKADRRERVQRELDAEFSQQQ